MTKQKIRNIIGIISTVVGIIGGLYVGGWLMFIEPIMDACRAFDAGVLTGAIIGATVIKCVFASFVGSLIFLVGYYLGIMIIYKD